MGNINNLEFLVVCRYFNSSFYSYFCFRKIEQVKAKIEEGEAKEISVTNMAVAIAEARIDAVSHLLLPPFSLHPTN